MSTLRRNLLKTLVLITSLASAVPALSAIDPNSTEAPMRRPNEALSEQQVHWVLKHVDHAVLSTVDNTGTPYGVPITPFYLNGKIYFHSNGLEGRKVKNLAQNPKVSLCYIALQNTNEPQLDVDLVSVIVAGTARPITDSAEKRKLMRDFLARHTPSLDIEKEVHKREQKIDRFVTVYEITPDKISGKSNVKEKFFGKMAVNNKS